MNWLFPFWLLLAPPPAQADLVRQARQSLVRAEQAATQSGEACKSTDYDKCNTLLTEVQEAVEKAKDSLDKTGLNPARSPRHFKDAEIRTRKILKLLRAVVSYIHPDDRPRFDTAVGRVSDINDQLLSSIMEKKRK